MLIEGLNKSVYTKADSQEYIVIWEVSSFVDHPRSRLSGALLIVNLFASLKTVQQDLKDHGDNTPASLSPVRSTYTKSPLSPDRNAEDSVHDQILPEFVAQDANLFLSLEFDPQLKHSRPYLPASKVTLSSKSSDSSNHMNSNKPDRHSSLEISSLTSSTKVPITSALNLRLRCSKATGLTDGVVGMLEVESGDIANVDIIVRTLRIELSGGSAVPVGTISTPISLKPLDSIVLAYQLIHSEFQQPSRVKTISIYVESIAVENGVAKNPEFEEFLPTIITKWDTVIDFSALPNPPSNLRDITLLNSSAAKRLFRANRSASTASLLSSGRPKQSIQLAGISLSFSGPNCVKVGQVFSWKIFVINRSSTSRHLSLYIQPVDPSDRLERSEKSLPKSPIKGLGSSKLYPMMDRSALIYMHQSRSLGNIGIISLMNDIRLSPLHSQTCFESEIKLLALEPGLHSLDGVNIIDHNTGDAYDCGKLFDVVVSE